MIISFQELKSEEYVLNLVFCLNKFDYSQSVCRWVSGRWVGGSVVGGFNKTLSNKRLEKGESKLFVDK